MLHFAKPNRAIVLLEIDLVCCGWLIVPTLCEAQTPDGVVAITAEPDHKIRFDNGRVRMYEVTRGHPTLCQVIGCDYARVRRYS